MDVDAPLIADRQPSVAIQPRQGPLDDPPMPPQALAGVDPLAGDADLDPAPVQEPTTALQQQERAQDPQPEQPAQQEPEVEVSVQEESEYVDPELNVPVQEEPAASGCDPNYTPCVPISAADLDCADIGFSVTIVGSDPHGFDGFRQRRIPLRESLASHKSEQVVGKRGRGMTPNLTSATHVGWEPWVPLQRTSPLVAAPGNLPKTVIMCGRSTCYN